MLQPNATLTMTLSSIQITKNPKKSPIIILAATSSVVLILKTTMMTIRMVTLLVPLLPLPPIATLIMPLLEEIIRIIRCAYRVLAIRTQTEFILHHHHRWWKWIKRLRWINNVKWVNDVNTDTDTDQGSLAIQTEFYYVFLNENDENHPCHRLRYQ